MADDKLYVRQIKQTYNPHVVRKIIAGLDGADFTEENVKPILLDLGIIEPPNLDATKANAIKNVDKQFEARIALGCVTSIQNIKMKSQFEDASIVKQVADWCIEKGQASMQVKDINREKHEVFPSEALQIADDIAVNYMTLWTIREQLVDAIKLATSVDQVEVIQWP